MSVWFCEFYLQILLIEFRTLFDRFHQAFIHFNLVRPSPSLRLIMCLESKCQLINCILDVRFDGHLLCYAAKLIMSIYNSLDRNFYDPFTTQTFHLFHVFARDQRHLCEVLFMVEVRVYYLSNKESEFVSIDMHEAKIAVEFTLILFQIKFLL